MENSSFILFLAMSVNISIFLAAIFFGIRKFKSGNKGITTKVRAQNYDEAWNLVLKSVTGLILLKDIQKEKGRIKGTGIGGISIASWGEIIIVELSQTPNQGEYTVTIKCYGIIPLQLFPRDYSKNILANLQLNGA